MRARVHTQIHRVLMKKCQFYVFCNLFSLDRKLMQELLILTLCQVHIN